MAAATWILVAPARGLQRMLPGVLALQVTQPAVQLYTANYLGDTRCTGGKVFGKFGAFCLETQHYPDSPNHPNFPSTILRPGAQYRSTTIYRFATTG